MTGFETYLGNYRVLKRMMAQMEVPCSLLSDPSEVLDTPADGHYRMYAGGTTQQEMRDAPDAIDTLLLQPRHLVKSKKWCRSPGPACHRSVHPNGTDRDRRTADGG